MTENIDPSDQSKPLQPTQEQIEHAQGVVFGVRDMVSKVEDLVRLRREYNLLGQEEREADARGGLTEYAKQKYLSGAESEDETVYETEVAGRPGKHNVMVAYDAGEFANSSGVFIGRVERVFSHDQHMHVSATRQQAVITEDGFVTINTATKQIDPSEYGTKRLDDLTFVDDEPMAMPFGGDIADQVQAGLGLVVNQFDRLRAYSRAAAEAIKYQDRDDPGMN